MPTFTTPSVPGWCSTESGSEEAIEIARREELATWKVVVTLLRKANALTDLDLDATPDTPPNTPGLRIILAIIRWGDASTALAKMAGDIEEREAAVR